MDINRKKVVTGPRFDEKCKIAGNMVNAIRKEAKFFKIGMTSDLSKRGDGDDYREGGYDFIDELYRSQSEERVKDMETYLIKRFKKYDNCKNIKPGGEGKLKWGPPFSVYIAYKKK